MNTLSFQDFKDKRMKAKEKAVYEEIKNHAKDYEEALEIIATLPKEYITRLVKYCLKHHVSFNDLKEKEE